MRAAIRAIVAEGIVYFRPRASRVRPYLSAGPGVTLLRGSANGAMERIAATKASIRVAVGIDLKMSKRIWFRYSFGETIQRNALSQALNPPGERNLENFQNFWGVFIRF